MSKIDLRQGDCLELMKDIPDASIDMILADLPYGTTRNKWDTIIPLEPLWEQYERVIKQNGAIVLFSQQPFTSTLVSSNPALFRYEWIWEKANSTGFLNANKMPLKLHENIAVFYNKLPTYNPQMRTGLQPYTTTRGALGTNYGKVPARHVSNSDGSRYPVDIIKFNKDHGMHPTQKPVALTEYLVRTYTNAGDTVLDNCMGSGTTGVACKNLGRDFIGIELDEKYFNIAKERIENYEVADIPRAVKQAREKKEGSEMKQLINDELNELLLDIRESLGSVLDHPGDLESKEDEIKVVFADIQKAIDMTEPIKLTEQEQQSYKVLKNVWKAIEKRDVEEAFYYWRMEDETEIDKNSQITVMKKFLNEVAE